MQFLSHTANARLPTASGEFEIHTFTDNRNGIEHVALAHGNIHGAQSPLVRVHSECLTGDVFGSSRCDCGAQLALAQKRVQEAGLGLILYLRNHEGRGIGLTNKIQAYRLQDQGMDTVEANVALGLPVDGRTYEAAVDILHYFDIDSIRLLSNNHEKRQAMHDMGIHIVDQLPLLTPPTAENLKYLQTKSAKLGHSIPNMHQQHKIAKDF